MSKESFLFGISSDLGAKASYNYGSLQGGGKFSRRCMWKGWGDEKGVIQCLRALGLP